MSVRVCLYFIVSENSLKKGYFGANYPFGQKLESYLICNFSVVKASVF